MRNTPVIRAAQFVLAASIVVLTLGVSAAAQDRDAPPVSISDLLRLRTITDIDVAPSGAFAIITVREIDPTDAPPYEVDATTTPAYRTHLHRIDLTRPGASLIPLTSGERGGGGASISPNGRELAFIRRGEDENAPQVWVLNLGGGEARQVTTLEHGAASVSWYPDARSLLVTVNEPVTRDDTPPWPSERPGRAHNDATHDAPTPDGDTQQLRAWLADNASKNDPTVINRLNFQGELSLRRDRRVGRLYRVNREGETWGDAELIAGGWFNRSGAIVTPRGDTILFAKREVTTADPDRDLGGDLWIMDLDGSNERVFLSSPDWRYSSPRPSGDGSVIAVIGQRMDEPWYRGRQLGLVSRDGEPDREPLWLTGPSIMDVSVRSHRWLPARSEVVFNTSYRGGVPLMVASTGLAAPDAIVDRRDELPVGVQVFDVGGGAIVYAENRVDAPCVLRVRDTRGDRLLADLNPWVAQRSLSRPVRGETTRPDGLTVEYWIMPPTNLADDGTKHPTVLEIHGGPSAMWGPGERSMWHEFQVLCGWGYGVVYANPRGSGGYGEAFQRGNHQDWGAGPAGDVLAALDEATLLPWVDAERLFVTGGSYGGYLTAWIVANDQRFKAAVAQRGVYDLNTFFGEGNAWRLFEWAMGGPPWDARLQPVIRRNNPFSYVNRIRTPLLIMHASQDLRTGVSQSEMMYRALQSMGRPVEYVRYPNAGHDLSRTGDPTQRMDRLGRIVEFFERYR